MEIGFDVSRVHGYTMPVPIPGVMVPIDIIPVTLSYGTGNHLPETPAWTRMGGLIRHIIKQVSGMRWEVKEKNV